MSVHALPLTSWRRTQACATTATAPPTPPNAARLRAEIDGLVAHLCGLTEAEFSHILASFPLVPEPAKQAARNAYRDVERGLIQ